MIDPRVLLSSFLGSAAGVSFVLLLCVVAFCVWFFL
jgi:hypothetical protein